MNQDVNGNRKLFWKEVSEANGGKVENSNRIWDEHGMYWKRLKCKGFASNIIYIYIWGGGVWVQLLGRQGAHARVILVLLECIWNAPEVSL